MPSSAKIGAYTHVICSMTFIAIQSEFFNVLLKTQEVSFACSSFRVLECARPWKSIASLRAFYIYRPRPTSLLYYRNAANSSPRLQLVQHILPLPVSVGQATFNLLWQKCAKQNSSRNGSRK